MRLAKVLGDPLQNVILKIALWDLSGDRDLLFALWMRAVELQALCVSLQRNNFSWASDCEILATVFALIGFGVQSFNRFAALR